jgi:hypothetical protein
LYFHIWFIAGFATLAKSFNGWLSFWLNLHMGDRHFGWIFQEVTITLATSQNWLQKHWYLSTLANSTILILFSEMLKFSRKLFLPNQKNIVKENSGYWRIFHLVKWMFQKLINYSMDMCWNGQGTMLAIPSWALDRKHWIGFCSFKYNKIA